MLNIARCNFNRLFWLSKAFTSSQGETIHLIQTRRERPKSALYLRLKKRKFFKTFPALIYEKLTKQFRDTQRVPFMLDKTRKPLFPIWEQKKTFFFEI